jgi:thiol-disulfide isomerase/thioredoxin
MKIFFLAFFITSALASQAFSGTPGEVKVGGYLRETPLHGFDGKIKSFSDYKGKPLVINVWASWCGPCRAEMGSLERLARRFNGKAFNVIGVSTDDSQYAAKAFIEQAGVTFDNFLDRRLLLENMLGANTIPLTILVGTDGQVLTKVRGSREWDSQQNIDAIKKIFNLESKDDPMFGLHIFR